MWSPDKVTGGRSDPTLSIAYALSDPAEQLHVFLQLEMDEGDEIDAMLHQTGGGGDEDKKPNTGDQETCKNIGMVSQMSLQATSYTPSMSMTSTPGLLYVE
nr:hypothetical protein [Tanacetum cinerariifolium]